MFYHILYYSRFTNKNVNIEIIKEDNTHLIWNN